jgi:hypothetical protein
MEQTLRIGEVMDLMEDRIYLSKRNLLTLLSKLERFEQGQETKCAIIKYANPLDPYCNTMGEVMVIAIPDEKFYTNRAAGEVHPLDEPK